MALLVYFIVGLERFTAFGGNTVPYMNYILLNKTVY
jgi:hypothetical protein